MTLDRTRVGSLARVGLLALVAWCGAAGPGSAAETPARIRAVVDAAIRPVMAAHDVPGMAVAVTIAGEAHILNYGVASRETGAPVGDATIFEVGSVSKTFTATLAGYAEALGRLSLDAHPGTLMPELKGRPIDAATLLHLGTYTAGGLPLQLPDGIAGQTGMVGYFARWKPDAAPGTMRRYSNPSLGLFGLLTARALGRDFADAMEADLLPRLGLARTHIRVPDRAMAAYAWGYGKANTPIRVNPALFDAEAYGIKSTAADMIRFVQANIDPSRLEGPSRRAVEATHRGYFGVGPMVQGLGWEQYPYPVALERLLAGNAEAMILQPNPATPLDPPRAPTGPTLFNKTGSTGGFGAYVAFVPDRKIGIVMLANRNFPIPARIRAAHAILEGLDSATR